MSDQNEFPKGVTLERIELFNDRYTQEIRAEFSNGYRCGVRIDCPGSKAMVQIALSNLIMLIELAPELRQ